MCNDALKAPCALYALLNPAFDRLQGRRKLGRLRAARLRHVGPAAALAADLLRDEIDELARLHPAREIRGDACDERDLAVAHRAQDDGGALQAAFQLVDRLAQALRVRAIDRGSKDLGAFHVDRLRGEIRALSRSELRA